MDAYQAVSESFSRCGEADDFYDTFYDVFLAKSAEIPPLFANTVFTRQKQILKATVNIMVRHRLDEEIAQRILGGVGDSHNRQGYNIRPELYTLWLDSLCETVARHDPMHTVELESHWRQRMKEGIDFIVAKY